jgi:polyphosphate kinase
MLTGIETKPSLPYTQNRDVSWLRFNDRVLDIAADPSVPLFERFRFLDIHIRNLDEFFMIRIGSQSDYVNAVPDAVDWRTGKKVKDVIRELFALIKTGMERVDAVYLALMDRLRSEGMTVLTDGDLDDVTGKLADTVFKERVMNRLDPVLTGPDDSFPDIESEVPHVLVHLVTPSGDQLVGCVRIPASGSVYLKLPQAGYRLIHVEDLVLRNVHRLFPGMDVTARTLFQVTRNADINFYDDIYDDAHNMRVRVKELLSVRNRLSVDRIVVRKPSDKTVFGTLVRLTGVSPHQVHQTDVPLILDLDEIRTFLEGTYDPARHRHPPHHPVWPSRLERERPVSVQVMKKDVMLHLPYESFDPVIRLIEEAAYDGNVVSIKITVYRLARRSRLVDALILAAERGKDVLVVMELRARFDEMNNIVFSERLERAGCRIVHGLGTFKVHSKLILITYKNHLPARFLSVIGTGNHHEVTVRQYTDIVLMTAHEGIGVDATRFFDALEQGVRPTGLDHLVVAPTGFRKTIVSKIATEAKKGPQGRIRIKINAITDGLMMDALVKASREGVPIDILARSITCLLPGVVGHTESIRMVSIVGRFLEHARIFAFGGDDGHVYIASADMMTRNTERRIEVAVPVYDPDIRLEIIRILDLQINDRILGRTIDACGRHVATKDVPDTADSQTVFMDTHDPREETGDNRS